MIDEKRTKRYCSEDISLIKNYDKAIADTTQCWVCHHKDEVKILPSGIEVRRTKEELIENGRYYNCPANELIFLTKGEHNRLHHKGQSHSYETKIKIGDANKNKQINSDFGKKYFEHFGYSCAENLNQYHKERMWYTKHNNTCRWEMNTNERN